MMYTPDAKVIWNGNTVPPDPPSMSAFLDALPLSRHDLQSLDCHPLPRTSLSPSPLLSSSSHHFQLTRSTMYQPYP